LDFAHADPYGFVRSANENIFVCKAPMGSPPRGWHPQQNHAVSRLPQLDASRFQYGQWWVDDVVDGLPNSPSKFVRFRHWIRFDSALWMISTFLNTNAHNTAQGVREGYDFIRDLIPRVFSDRLASMPRIGPRPRFAWQV
jgi:hypothetical protein